MARPGTGSGGTQDTVGVAAVLSDAPAEKRVFTVRDVRKVYTMGDVEVHALPSIDLEVRESELVTLLGASGSGKSTLLNILGGLDVPSGGSVLFRDLDLSAASDETRTTYRRESAGFVFQFYNLIPSLTARENVALVTDIAVEPMPAEEALDRAGMPARLEGWGGSTAIPARVRIIEPFAFTHTSALGVEEQRVNVILDLEERPESLGDGYRVEASILIWAAENVLTVPSSALFRTGSGWQLFVVEDGRAQLRDVVVGERSGVTAQITQGLSEGELVLEFPPDEIHDGIRAEAASTT
jgi:predicted ABC-type transport system involved in lysophospholipase L1 biosynthesis ATPase subunit